MAVLLYGPSKITERAESLVDHLCVPAFLSCVGNQTEERLLPWMPMVGLPLGALSREHGEHIGALKRINEERRTLDRENCHS